MKISLYNLKFYAYHGVHAEEKVLGTEFEVNVEVEIQQQGRINSIHQTINYVDVYEVIKKRMSQPTELLETLVEDLIEQIKLLSTQIKTINVHIKKINPPINNFVGSVSVSQTREF